MQKYLVGKCSSAVNWQKKFAKNFFSANCAIKNRFAKVARLSLSFHPFMIIGYVAIVKCGEGTFQRTHFMFENLCLA